MNASLRLTLGLAAAATAAALAAWTLARLRWRRKTPEEIERLRRLEINRRGRITVGQVVDIVESDPSKGEGVRVVYQYEVAGVSYEVSQNISALPALAAAAHTLLGHVASIKYDPKVPTNSIVACEEWSGISLKDVTRDSGLGTREEPRSSVAST
ncbi:MAG: DUF3592 domain-containing protein [Terriglobia bacterium]